MVADGFDHKFVLTITEDSMQVLMSVRVDIKKINITLEEVKDALQSLGVVYGVSDTAIANVLKIGQAENMIVAQGLAVEEGSAGSFVSLLEQLDPRFGKEYDENEDVDLREFGNLIIANKGDALMRRIPVVPGKPGMNVFGETVAPTKHKDVSFATNLTGTEFHPDDSNLLIASVSGVPRIVKDGVTVDPLLVVKGVNLASGNVRFDGALRVKGDVQAGMKVDVTGDIQVDGVIEAAEVRAGGNITIKGGIIGNSSIKNTLNDPSQPNAKIYCQNLVTKYIDSAFVKVLGTITVSNEIRQSQVEAGKRVSVGRKGSKRNAIIGGKIQAFEYVSSAVFGSEAGTPTEIIVGASNGLMDEMYDLISRIDTTQEEVKKLNQLLTVLMAKPDYENNDIFKKTSTTVDQRKQELSELTRKKEMISSLLNPKVQPAILATYQFYAGTTLSIRQMKTVLKVDRPAGRACIIGNDIVIT